ncbi:MAG: adenylate kinase [Candidatus Marinimicrobia bacterium]|nr:adenylate kinase [Candidatus Neomarinimicrobiota bacterium]MDD5582034.1 adenylate kinase [Candidatus Neomarinimicrobiota bacterium]
MRLVFLGAPGSGKGTQADILKDIYSLIKLSTGDLLRNEIKKATPLGKKAETFMNQGILVPDDIMIDILEKKITSFEKEGTGYILDGFPRTLHQAEALDAMLLKNNAPLDAVIFIDVPEDELLYRLTNRWTCRTCNATFPLDKKSAEIATCPICGSKNLYQREDDKPETIIKRLDVYRKNTYPLIDYYEKMGILHRVSGLGDIETVTKRIQEVLENI